MGVNTVRTVMVAGDETSRWEEVEKYDGWWLFILLETSSTLKVTDKKPACERRSMTNQIKFKSGPVYLCEAAIHSVDLILKLFFHQGGLY